MHKHGFLYVYMGEKDEIILVIIICISKIPINGVNTGKMASISFENFTFMENFVWFCKISYRKPKKSTLKRKIYSYSQNILSKLRKVICRLPLAQDFPPVGEPLVACRTLHRGNLGRDGVEVVFHTVGTIGESQGGYYTECFQHRKKIYCIR